MIVWSSKCDSKIYKLYAMLSRFSIAMKYKTIHVFVFLLYNEVRESKMLTTCTKFHTQMVGDSEL